MRHGELDLTTTPADIDYTCPRCGSRATARLYGPCTTCATELRATVAGVRDVNAIAPEFEPRMNVTPNAVALKDD